MVPVSVAVVKRTISQPFAAEPIAATLMEASNCMAARVLLLNSPPVVTTVSVLVSSMTLPPVKLPRVVLHEPITDAVVVGDRRAFLTALVMIDHENVERYAQELNVPFTNFQSLCRTREVQDLIQAEIDRVNAKFARVEQVKKFRLIEHKLTAEDEELTPTMKLKRKLVEKKYAPQIEAMYK